MLRRKTKKNVKFSDEFKIQVLKALGDWGDVKKLLNDNNYFIGRYINDAMENCSCGCTRDATTEFGKKQIELIRLYDAWDTYFFVEPYTKVVI